ncbi:MAG: amidase, partial [Burkholderiaceae bacterium]|nr:amidase [Burkholderiaceae bacterium]
LAGLLKAGAVLMLPTMPDIAPRLDEDEHSLDLYRNRAMRVLCWASLAGLPQVTIPLARRLGAPLGMSLIGPAGSDLSLVRLAARIWSTAAA